MLALSRGAEGPGGGAELRRLRLFLTITILATFVLVIVGGVVRITDSGLGCGPAASGVEGWPLCGGRALPLIEEKAVIEFSHRLLASVVGLLAILCVWQARKVPGEQRFLRRGTVAALVLVIAQGALGGLTVEKNLHEYLVAAHLGLAMIFGGLLLTLLWAAREQQQSTPRLSGRGLRPLAIAATALVLATVVAGGVVAGTEEEGVRNGAVNGAHLACGEEFPGCLDGVLPFGKHGRLADIQLTHRALVYVTTATILALLGLAAYRRRWSWELSALAVLLVVQLLLGALNVWLGKHPTLIVAHLTVGTLLWAAAVSTTLRLSPAPQTVHRPTAAEPKTSAAPA